MTECRVDGCNNNVRVVKHSLCSKHYDRWRKTGDPLGFLPGRWDSHDIPPCKVDGCDEQSKCKGYCPKHYTRWKKHGDPLATKTKRHREYGTGKRWHQTLDGYVVRYEPSNPNAGPNGQVYQHRHVISKMLGRPLRSGENVHHKNGNRSDNRPENLELWVSGQPRGQRIQDVAQWCVNWLNQADLESVLVLCPELEYDLDRLRQKLKGV